MLFALVIMVDIYQIALSKVWPGVLLPQVSNGQVTYVLENIGRI